MFLFSRALLPCCVLLAEEVQVQACYALAKLAENGGARLRRAIVTAGGITLLRRARDAGMGGTDNHDYAGDALAILDRGGCRCAVM